MQTILGAGGAIGTELAKALIDYTKDIRLVSRNPKKVNDSDQLYPANILNFDELDKAIEGSEIVYLTIGFEYKLSVWKENWPKLMKNVIKLCQKHDCKLVFFDNIYMYDKNYLDGMTEETPINPSSEKGKIRTQVAQMLLDEVSKGKLTALIARSADFYGPSIKNTSMMTETVFNPFSKGKTANWIGDVNMLHTFTFTPDAGKATALLGNTEDAYQQVWHLPTAAHPLTGKQWIENIAKEMGVKPKYQTATKFLVKILGWFMPIMKEVHEMYYQFDRNYVFNSDKFENRFNFKPTPYLEGIKIIVNTDYK